MSLNRRQFLKSAGIGSAALVGGASLLKTNSAFAAYPAPMTSQLSFIGATLTGGTFPSQTFSYTSQYVASNSALTGRRGLIYDVLMPFQAQIAAGIGTGATAKTIVIKPNLVYAQSSGAQAILNATHVDALKGLIDFIRAMPGFSAVPIIIAESSATDGINMMNWCSYPGLLNSYTGLTLVDLNRNCTVTAAGAQGSDAGFPGATSYLWGNDLKSTVQVKVVPFFLSKDYYVISIARPKTHNCQVMTGVTKNCSMGMPLQNGTSGGAYKTKMHGPGTNSQGQTAGEDEVLSWNQFQNATQYTLNGHPDLSILDAWEGEQHNGPVSGTSVMQGCAVAGFDHLAVDRICAVLMGFSDTPMLDQASPAVTHSYTDPRYLVWMSNAGIGNYDLSKIAFVNSNTTIDTVRQYKQTYQLADNYTATPYWETQWLAKDTAKGPDTSAPNSPFAFPPKDTGVLKGAMPYMAQQANMHVNGVVRTNEIKIDLFLPAAFNISLGIYNLKGQLVRRLGNEFLNNGRYSITWNLRDDSGAKVPNGNYIIRLNSNQYQLSDKITLAR